MRRSTACGAKFGAPCTIEETSLGELTLLFVLLKIRPFTVAGVPAVNVVAETLTKLVCVEVMTKRLLIGFGARLVKRLGSDVTVNLPDPAVDSPTDAVHCD